MDAEDPQDAAAAGEREGEGGQQEDRESQGGRGGAARDLRDPGGADDSV